MSSPGDRLCGPLCAKHKERGGGSIAPAAKKCCAACPKTPLWTTIYNEGSSQRRKEQPVPPVSAPENRPGGKRVIPMGRERAPGENSGPGDGSGPQKIKN